MHTLLMLEIKYKYYAQMFGGVINALYICPIIHTKKCDKMTTVKNSTGTKAVNISDQSAVSGFSNFYARYVQIYNGDEQVLEVKICSTMAAAERWASKKLSA